MPRQTKYRIIINVKPQPKPFEISAAELVSLFLRADVEFIQSQSSKTPDLLIANQLWEMKSPTGSGSRTVLHQFQRASKQAQYMIFDSRRIKIDPKKCLSQVQAQFKNSHAIKRVIFIDKEGIVSEL